MNKHSLLDLAREASLIERLKEENPDFFTDPINIGGRYLKDVKATTIIAIKFGGGIVAASDGQATAGNMIGFDRFDKLVRVDKRDIIAIAGVPSLALQICRMIKAEIKTWNGNYTNKLSTEGKLSRLSAILRKNISALGAGIVVVPIYATFDLEKMEPRIFQFEPAGSYVERDFHAEGSGGPFAGSVISSRYDHHNPPTKDEAVEVAIAALAEAHRRDSATGENLFIKIIGRDGVDRVDPEKIIEIQERIKGRR